jgi:hypothetical protein
VSGNFFETIRVSSCSEVIQKEPLKSNVCKNNLSHGHICLVSSATDKYYVDSFNDFIPKMPSTAYKRFINS